MRLSGKIIGNANAALRVGGLGANTAPVVDSFRAGIEPQPQKVYPYTKTAHRPASPLTLAVAPAVQIVPAYYFPTPGAESPKSTNQKKKSSSGKRGTSKKTGNHSNGSHPQTESPSYDDSVKPQSKSVLAPNQIASEYLDAYFNYLKAYTSNQEQENTY